MRSGNISSGFLMVLLTGADGVMGGWDTSPI